METENTELEWLLNLVKDRGEEGLRGPVLMSHTHTELTLAVLRHFCPPLCLSHAPSFFPLHKHMYKTCIYIIYIYIYIYIYIFFFIS